MRIVTWNMGYWGHARAHDDAWKWLLDDLQPDVALLQECVVPDWVRERRSVQFERAYASRPWGTGLATREDVELVALLEVEDWLERLGPDAREICSATRLPSWCVAVQMNLPAVGEVLTLSVHNPAFPIDPVLLRDIDVSGLKLELNDKVWLLDVLFYFLKNRLNRPLLIGGDFNYSRLLDDPTPRGNNEFFDRISDEGFMNLLGLFQPQDQQTYFSEGKRPHQLDYLYADKTVADRVEDCFVVPRTKAVERFSDHAPVVADLGIE
jgi:exonuclease III